MKSLNWLILFVTVPFGHCERFPMVVLCGLEHYLEGRHGEYLHGTLANDDERGNGKQNDLCASCKSIWTDRTCVVEFSVQNQKDYCSIICDDWVKHRENVYEAGWTLCYSDGYLKEGM